MVPAHDEVGNEDRHGGENTISKTLDWVPLQYIEYLPRRRGDAPVRDTLLLFLLYYCYYLMGVQEQGKQQIIVVARLHVNVKCFIYLFSWPADKRMDYASSFRWQCSAARLLLAP